MYDGGTTGALYLDGNLADHALVVLATTTYGSTHFGGPDFRGALDEGRIYSDALSQDDVQALVDMYTARRTIAPSTTFEPTAVPTTGEPTVTPVPSVTSVPTVSPTDSGLLAHYTFDNGTATNDADYETTPYYYYFFYYPTIEDLDCDVVRGSPTEDRFGQVDGALGDAFVRCDLAKYLDDQERSICLWATIREATTPEVTLFDYGDNAESCALMQLKFRGDDNLVLDFGSFDTSPNCVDLSFVAKDDFALGEWHHYCVTYDLTDVALYVDGDLVARSRAELRTGLSSLYFGSFNGVAIDEAYIFTRALTRDAVRALADDYTARPTYAPTTTMTPTRCPTAMDDRVLLFYVWDGETNEVMFPLLNDTVIDGGLRSHVNIEARVGTTMTSFDSIRFRLDGIDVRNVSFDDDPYFLFGGRSNFLDIGSHVLEAAMLMNDEIIFSTTVTFDVMPSGFVESVSGRSGNECLDAFFFHFRDGITRSYGIMSTNAESDDVVLDEAEVISAVTQFEESARCGGPLDLAAGVRLTIFNAVANSERVVDFHGPSTTFDTSVSSRHFQVDWPCQIVGVKLRYGSPVVVSDVVTICDYYDDVPTPAPTMNYDDHLLRVVVLDGDDVFFPLTNGTEISNGMALNVEYLSFTSVDVVWFHLNGVLVKEERVPPYYLFGDENGSPNFESFEDPGAYDLEAVGWVNDTIVHRAEVTFQVTPAKGLVAAISAVVGWCLDEFTFRFRDGTTESFGLPSNGSPTPEWDLSPDELITGITQFRPHTPSSFCYSTWLSGGIRITIENGISSRFIDIHGCESFVWYGDDLGDVLNDFYVDFPCQIVGATLDTSGNPARIDDVITVC